MKASVFGAATAVLLLSLPGVAAAQRATVAAVDSSAEMSLRYEEGRIAGTAAAGEISSTSWFAGGLLAGTLAGPVGAAVAVAYADGSDVPVAPPPGDGDAFREGYSDALLERVRAGRKRNAFIGGMIGSGIFVFALIQVLDVNGLGGGGGEDGGGGGPVLLIQPG